MSWKLTTREYEEEIKEYMEETTIKPAVPTVKLWDKESIQNTIIDLTEQIVTLEERITVLTEQLARFTKK